MLLLVNHQIVYNLLVFAYRQRKKFLSDLQATFQDLVLIGGGHSHAIVLRMFGMKPLPGVRLTLITENSDTPYSGMLPGHIAGFYSHDECHIDLQRLANFAQAQLYIDRVVGLDLENNLVLCANRPAVAFDVLSIDIGSTPSIISVPGAAEHAIPAKPVSQLLKHWYQLCLEVTCNISTSSIAIVGGGAGGVELALSMSANLHRRGAVSAPLQEWGVGSGEWADEGDEIKPHDARCLKSGNPPTALAPPCPIPHSPLPTPHSPLPIHLFQRHAELMPNYHQSTQRQVKQILLQRGIQLHLGETVSQVEPHKVICESGLTVECNPIFWVTQASAPQWLKTTGLATDEQGFILVQDTLQSQTHPQVFATGDIATMVNHPRPKAGVFAVRQGKPLFENLQRILFGKTLKPYQPEKQYLSLIGTGDKSAIATRGIFTLPPHKLLWIWKDWIDRRFMESFRNLPEMGSRE